MEVNQHYHFLVDAGFMGLNFSTCLPSGRQNKTSTPMGITMWDVFYPDLVEVKLL